MGLKIIALSLLLSVLCTSAVTGELERESIIGGDKISVEERKFYPYLVSIRNGDKYHKCSGSLINSDTVLSAAHCFVHNNGTLTRKEYIVVAGDNTKYSYESPIAVSYVYTHTDFMEDVKGHFHYDIAVAKLERSFPIGPGTSINPINLSGFRENFEGQNGTIVGFGFNYVEKNNSPLPNEPKYLYSSDPEGYSYRLNVEILHDADCIHSSILICARSFKPESGGCAGDSGGPLVVGDKVVGIGSFGSVRCDDSTGIGAKYTKVAILTRWIENAMMNDNSTKNLLLHYVKPTKLSNN